MILEFEVSQSLINFGPKVDLTSCCKHNRWGGHKCNVPGFQWIRGITTRAKQPSAVTTRHMSPRYFFQPLPVPAILTQVCGFTTKGLVTNKGNNVCSGESCLIKWIFSSGIEAATFLAWAKEDTSTQIQPGNVKQAITDLTWTSGSIWCVARDSALNAASSSQPI